MTVQTRKARQAPGPDGRFPLGRMADFQRDTLGMMRGLGEEYGGLVRIRMGPYLVHQVTEPALVKHILQDEPDRYVRGRFYRRFSLFFGQGMLTTDGEQWWQRRSVGQPFFSRAAVGEAAPLITGCVADLLRHWESPAARRQPVDIVPGTMSLAMGVISRLLFGVDLRDRAGELLPATRFAIGAMIMTGKPEQFLPGWMPTRYQRTLRRSQAVLDAAMDAVIGSHRDGSMGDGLVGRLLTATDPATGAAWDQRQVRSELKTHFLAGHETTGCALAWTLYMLARHPVVCSRLSTEVDEVLGGRVPTAADLTRMNYLQQVVDESLRRYPPIWAFPRDTVHDGELGGYHLPAGSSLLLSPYAAHHDRRAWPAPDVFDPDRFSSGCPGPARYTYFPFGGGPRRCIGANLAQLEIQLAVAMIIQRYRLQVLPGRRVLPTPLVSLRPRHGILLILSDKHQGGTR